MPANLGQPADLVGGHVDGAHVGELGVSLLHREPADRIGDRDQVTSTQRAIDLVWRIGRSVPFGSVWTRR